MQRRSNAKELAARDARVSGRGVRFALPVAAALLLSLGCASSGPAPPAPTPEPFPGVVAADRPYLVDPLTGYPYAVDAQRRTALAAGYQALRDAGDAAAARRAAGELLAGEPGLHPAQVLAAQAAFADRDPSRALERVRPVAEELPGYTAAQLLRGRAAEAAGEAVEAFEAYRAAAELSALAGERAAQIAPRAVEIVARRVDEALARGRLGEAEAAVARLRSWAPEDPTTLDAELRLAAAGGDDRAELAAARRLAAVRAGDSELALRLADLELAVGDAGAGLERFEELAERYPEDPRIAAGLERAKFRWRFTQLPARVTRLADSPELARGDYAVLLYWLVPRVRYGRPVAARIATDILDDPRRDEITRVVNLGLLDVDVTLHRFAPDDRVNRQQVLAGLLRLLADAEPPPACAASAALGSPPSSAAVCDVASRCHLVPSVADCLPRAAVSGSEAVDLIGRAVGALGT